ncbi:beta-lactamase family protein [Pedobacter sp. SD-b]|uniref:Beta-lactamase family protein n=1 Tax=Pedobacter segetis TaxID=2793069 RepID=A0ABS1BII5_9SPHI|nr:serine hydrolase domain-containing protein [Pedobacter segetis]MBK0382700.1 beta-lactamase family protein [Pedobacter segetis]
MIRFKLPILLLSIPLFLSACSSSSSKQKVEENKIDPKRDSLLLIYNPAKADKKLDEYFTDIHKKRNFNGNVLIAKKGKIIYEGHFGWADYLHRDSLKMGSQFQLASISKTMTGTAVLMLMERGKLKLSQTVDEFYPEFPYKGITIEMLLSHRSGLNNYVYFTDGIWKDKYKAMTNQDVIKLYAQYKPAPYFPPNRQFHYNNTNFMLLAAIVEKISGEDFDIFMKQNVFNPAGMKHTAIYSTAKYEKIPVDVVGHDRVWRRSVRQNFLDGPTGDKGVYSTVEDLFLFDRALRDGLLLKKSTLDSAYTPHSKLQNQYFGYGLGWRMFVDSTKNEQVIYHTGWWHGFRHIFLRDMKRDITIVILSNLVNGSINQIDDMYKILGMPVIRRGVSDED